jgi:DNA-binding MarR family transcriptional regulator
VSEQHYFDLGARKAVQQLTETASLFDMLQRLRNLIPSELPSIEFWTMTLLLRAAKESTGTLVIETAELAKAEAMPPSTVVRLVKALAEFGLLVLSEANTNCVAFSLSSTGRQLAGDLVAAAKLTTGSIVQDHHISE